MIGFFKRDMYHISINLRLYGILLLGMAALSFFGRVSSSFVALYAMIFCASSFFGLFSYDDVSDWQSYAAALPNGRRGQVDGRYLAALTATLCVAALLLLLSLFDGGWDMSVFALDIGLVYLGVAFPLTYWFGKKSRLILILLMALIAGGTSAAVSILSLSGGGAPFVATAPVALLALPPVLLLFAASWLLSRRIMTKKEF